MKLNNEYNFGVVPTIQTPRSRFLMHKNIRTTFNAGQLIPFYVNPLIQPGDRIKCKGTLVIRMTTPVVPTMDNLFADIRAFFIPHRLTWTHFKEFMGENTTGTWTQQTQYQIPQIAIYSDLNGGADTKHKIAKGDSLQYMGLPIGYPKSINTAPSVANCKTTVMALPWRSYALTWNYWYRDENFCPPLNIDLGDTTRPYGTWTGARWGQWSTQSNGQITTTCAPVYKFKDMFNACLPEPQKGTPITLPIGQYAPVIGDGKALGLTDGTALAGLQQAAAATGLVGVDNAYGANVGTSVSGSQNMTNGNAVGLTTDATKSGAIADLANAVAATINAQRMAFAAQRVLEACARSGTRFNELISGIWGVRGINSAVVQIPQVLGGYRLPLSMNQVVQTSSTDNVSPQGNTAAYSLTVDSQQLFDKGFEEWGTLLFCLCVRQEHSYAQGIELFWQKKNKYDFYWPQFAYLGEQAIPTKTIYADGSSNDDTVFGYNERWVEYRTETNLNTGAFSPDYAQSLDKWHYGDDYSQAPVLSDAWRRETPDYIDRTLAVAHTVEDQFLMDSRWEFDKTSSISLRSIPGLLDHF